MQMRAKVYTTSTKSYRPRIFWNITQIGISEYVEYVSKQFKMMFKMQEQLIQNKRKKPIKFNNL